MAEAGYTRDVRGVPLWLLREYLTELGGQGGGDEVSGPGWAARLTRLADYQIGSLRVGEVRVELEGEARAVARIGAALDQKLNTRGGG